MSIYGPWKEWFAWYPAKTEARWVWLRWVERAWREPTRLYPVPDGYYRHRDINEA